MGDEWQRDAQRKLGAGGILVESQVIWEKQHGWTEPPTSSVDKICLLWPPHGFWHISLLLALWIPNSFFDTNLREAIHSQQLVFPTKICFSFTSHRRPEVALVRRDPLIDWGEDDRGLWVGRCHLFGPQRALGEGTPISRLWRNRFFPNPINPISDNLHRNCNYLWYSVISFCMTVPPWTTWLHLFSKIFLINLFR